MARMLFIICNCLLQENVICLCSLYLFSLFLFTWEQICDAVAVAKILNATLVIPYFEVNLVWQDSRCLSNNSLDIAILFTSFHVSSFEEFIMLKSGPLSHLSCSSFGDIFDVDHFIDVLKDDISIVKELPEDFSWSTRRYYATRIRATRIKNAPVHASANWYQENVSPILERFVSLFIIYHEVKLLLQSLRPAIFCLHCLSINLDCLVLATDCKTLQPTSFLYYTGYLQSVLNSFILGELEQILRNCS